MPAFREQEHDPGDPPARVTEHRREPGVDARARGPVLRSVRGGGLVHRSTFRKVISPANLGIETRCEGEVMTSAVMAPGLGVCSLHSTINVLPAGFVPLTSTA